MEKMMKRFFSEMKGDDIKKFIKGMMSLGDKKHGFGSGGIMRKMMGGHSHKKGFNPMEMMHMMMGNGEKREDFNPMEMCSRMMSFMHENHRVSTLATPEVQGLFEDWVEQIEEEDINLFEKEKTPQSLLWRITLNFQRQCLLLPDQAGPKRKNRS